MRGVSYRGMVVVVGVGRGETSAGQAGGTEEDVHAVRVEAGSMSSFVGKLKVLHKAWRGTGEV